METPKFKHGPFYIISAIFLFLFNFHSIAIGDEISIVKSFQKISHTKGNFNGILDDTDTFGFVSKIGDIDGDNVMDIAVGARMDDDGGSDRGAVWLLFLNADGTVKRHQKISDTDGGFSGGLENGDWFGQGSPTGIGDLDGDGVADIVVGAEYDSDGGYRHGAIWILFLNPDGTVKTSQKINEIEGGFTGILKDHDAFGQSVACLGDLDGDGVVDMAVGAELSVWILFLNSDGTVKANQKISETEGGLDALLLPCGSFETSHFGIDVENIGDLNSDGVTDIAVGAWVQNSVFILFLNSDGTVKSHQEIGAQIGLRNATACSDYYSGGFGHSIAKLGDIDHDGVTDIAVGALVDDDGGYDHGAIWILSLNANGSVKSTKKISDIKGGFSGILDDRDLFGYSITDIGDLNGDGVTDIAVGAQGDDDGGPNRGAIWILFLDSEYHELHFLNRLISFEPVQSTYSFTADTTGCPAKYVGKFSFDATLTNSSSKELTALAVEIAKLTNENLLLTDMALLGEDERFPVSKADDYSDGILSLDEMVEVPFTFCLKNTRPFQFYVHVLGQHSDGELDNMLSNGSFEEGFYLPTEAPLDWFWDSWRPSAIPTWDDTLARTGDKSVKIDAPAPNDSRFIQTVDVESDTWYFLSGWVKTENVGHTAESVDAGANLSLFGTWTHTPGVFGTTDWTRESLLFNSGNDTQVTIAARLGYWSGTTTGTAWFDDLRLVPIVPMDPHPSWKILVLIYQNTNFEVTDSTGTSHHYVASMTEYEMQEAEFSAKQFVEIDIPALTSGNMIPEITVRFPERALTELSAIGSGWWPSPEDTALERDSEFDSVIVIWDPRAIDLTNNEYKWIGYGDGLAAYRGVQQTYLSMQVDAAVYRGHRNVFKHEWGHCILFFFDAMGTTPNPTVSNHATATEYVNCQTGQYYDWRDEMLSNPITNSIYNNESGFTHDYYSGTVATADQPSRCLGITPEAWALGGPVSHSGNLNRR